MKKRLYEIAVTHTFDKQTAILIKPVAILSTNEDAAKLKAGVMAVESAGKDLDLDECDILVRLFQ